MTRSEGEQRGDDRLEAEVERIASIIDAVKKEMGDDAIVEATLWRMGAAEGSDDEALVHNLLKRYGEDYLKDLTVALYYDGVARRAGHLGGDYEARIPGIALVIEQLRRGLNQPLPGRPELRPLEGVDEKVVRAHADREARNPI